MHITNCNCGCKHPHRDYISLNHDPSAPENRRRLPEYYSTPKALPGKVDDLKLARSER